MTKKKTEHGSEPLLDHPVGVGVGAAGGAAAGAAIGTAVAGPVGTAVGAVVGGVAGGLTGETIAEVIDPDEDDAYWEEHFRARPYTSPRSSFKQYQPAYQYGREAVVQHNGRSFEDVKEELKEGWPEARGHSRLSWGRAQKAARDAWDRTLKLHEEHLHPQKDVDRADVEVKKEVVTNMETVEVPVEREEVVIQRRPVKGRAAAEDIEPEEIRIPVKEEKVRVHKDTVVNEEVTVGKRKVQEKKKVSAPVRKERLKVNDKSKGKMAVREHATAGKA